MGGATQNAKKESMEMRTKKCVRCSGTYNAPAFTVSNRDKKGQRSRRKFKMAFKAPGAKWCADTGGAIQCDQNRVSKQGIFTMVKRGSKWTMMNGNGKYCAAGKGGSQEIKCTHKRAQRFRVKCTTGCKKYAIARRKAWLKLKNAKLKKRTLKRQLNAAVNEYKHVEYKKLHYIKGALKKLRARKSFQEEKHAAKLLSYRQVKQAFKKKREQRIQAQVVVSSAQKDLLEADNRIDAAKQVLKDREVAARKAVAVEHEKIKQLRRKNRHATMKALIRAAKAVQRKAEVIKAEYQKMHELQLRRVARAASTITRARQEEAKAQVLLKGAEVASKAAQKKLNDFAKTRESAAEQVKLAKKGKNKAVIEASNDLMSAMVERTNELAEKVQQQKGAENTASKEAANAEKRAVKAKTGMEDAHEAALQAAKAANNAVKRCHVAKERSGKAQLKMKKTVWQKLEDAAGETPDQ